MSSSAPRPCRTRRASASLQACKRHLDFVHSSGATSRQLLADKVPNPEERIQKRELFLHPMSLFLKHEFKNAACNLCVESLRSSCRLDSARRGALGQRKERKGKMGRPKDDVNSLTEEACWTVETTWSCFRSRTRELA